jgi:hypothetical protein
MTAATVIAPLALLAFYAYCLADFSRTPEWEMRTFDKRTWIGLLILTNVAGGVMWLGIGRPTRPHPR